MSEWVKYDGSDEQIAEMKKGFLYRNKSGVQSDITLYGNNFISSEHLKNHLKNIDATHYLICQPHPYADLIKTWADTGCPVFVKSKYGLNLLKLTGNNYTFIKQFCVGYSIYKTNAPDWNIPGAEYSLTPFED